MPYGPHLHVTYRSHAELDVADPDLRSFDWWTVAAKLRTADDEEESDVDVGYAHLVVIDPARFEFARWSFQEAADANGGDLVTLANVAYDGDELAPDLNELLEAPFGPVLYFDRLHVEPAHRGHSIGRRLAADAIVTLSRGCSAVLTFPAPFDPDGPEHGTAEHTAARERLERYWQQLGFSHLRDGLHVLDPALVNPKLHAHRAR